MDAAITNIKQACDRPYDNVSSCIRNPCCSLIDSGVWSALNHVCFSLCCLFGFVCQFRVSGNLPFLLAYWYPFCLMLKISLCRSLFFVPLLFFCTRHSCCFLYFFLFHAFLYISSNPSRLLARLVLSVSSSWLGIALSNPTAFATTLSLSRHL